MSGYAPGAQPLTPDRRLSPARPQNAAQLRSLAEYIASINFEHRSWKYPLKTHPRPSGRATHAIITEYDLPRALTEPHDVILDAHGMAWYSDFGAEVLGELDPRTGAVTEYPLPLLKPHFPAGSLDLELDKSGIIWMGMMLQAALPSSIQNQNVQDLPDADGVERQRGPNRNGRSTSERPSHHQRRRQEHGSSVGPGDESVADIRTV